MYTYVCMYVYIYRERDYIERGMYVCVYIYIYTHTSAAQALLFGLRLVLSITTYHIMLYY